MMMMMMKIMENLNISQVQGKKNKEEGKNKHHQ